MALVFAYLMRLPVRFLYECVARMKLLKGTFSGFALEFDELDACNIGSWSPRPHLKVLTCGLLLCVFVLWGPLHQVT